MTEPEISERQSDVAIRTLIAREIWRYQECEEAYGDFDKVSSSSIGMAALIKQTAIDQAEMIRAVILKSPVLVERICASAAKEEDDAYEIGKRDGYEEAIQTLDLATGGDGEFRGSTIPGQTVDVPAMQSRVLDRFSCARADAIRACKFEIDRLRCIPINTAHERFAALTEAYTALVQLANSDSH